MSLRDSESDFGGRLGASLTPRAPRARVQVPGEQNSGLIDMRALYAASVEQVMRRAQVARAHPPVVAFDPVAFDPIAVDEEPVVLPRRRLGWLPVMVVLLVLVATGGLFVARSDVPAVMHAKAALVPAVVRATTTLMSVVMRAEAVVVARVDRLIGRPLPVAAPVGVRPPEAPPVAPAPLPVATTPVLSPHVSQVGEAAPPVGDVEARIAPASAAPARTPVTRGHPKAAPEPAKVPTPAPAGADSKPMSLDDMIRHAVEAESKRKP